MLSEVVTKQENNKESIEKNNNNAEAKSYDVDSIENDKLEELIQSHAKMDKHKKDDISRKIEKKKEVEHDTKIMEKNIWQEDNQSCESDNDGCEEEYYDYYDDDDDDDYSYCLSDYDEWIKWNEKRAKHKRKVKSHSD